MNLRNNYIEEVVNYIKAMGLSVKNIDYMTYTLKHKIAFINTYRMIVGEPSQMAYQHDADKLAYYGIMLKEEASKLHRAKSNHHFSNCKTDEDMVNCIIDYECARFTKPDKPLNARDTILKYRTAYYDRFKPYLEAMHLDTETNGFNPTEDMTALRESDYQALLDNTKLIIKNTLSEMGYIKRFDDDGRYATDDYVNAVISYIRAKTGRDASKSTDIKQMLRNKVAFTNAYQNMVCGINIYVLAYNIDVIMGKLYNIEVRPKKLEELNPCHYMLSNDEKLMLFAEYESRKFILGSNWGHAINKIKSLGKGFQSGYESIIKQYRLDRKFSFNDDIKENIDGYILNLMLDWTFDIINRLISSNAMDFENKRIELNTYLRYRLN